jgi:hypothetical protein
MAALLLCALGSPGAGDARAQSRPVQPADAWSDARDEAPRFAFSLPLFDGAPLAHAARLRASDGGRLDQMALGDPATGPAGLRISFYRPGAQGAARVSFWLEMARRAGEAGLSLARAAPTPVLMETRLGRFELGELEAFGGEGARACLGFRRDSAEPPFVISGLACGPADAPPPRAALRCALEGLVFLAEGEDTHLAALFREAPAPAAECLPKTAEAPRQSSPRRRAERR